MELLLEWAESSSLISNTCGSIVGSLPWLPERGEASRKGVPKVMSSRVLVTVKLHSLVVSAIEGVGNRVVPLSMATKYGREGAGVMGRAETSDILSVDPSHSP